MDKVFAPDWEWNIHAIGFYDDLWWLFTAAALLYYPVVVYGLEKFMESRQPVTSLKPILIIYNWALTLFNLWCMFNIIPQNIWFVANYGMHRSICTLYIAYEGPWHVQCGRAMLLFVVSKMPEMLDTVFLRLRKKPVITLHWYHHLSVMLFCWHITYSGLFNEGGAGVFFASMNSSIHFIMYGYYACAAMGISLPGAQAITVIQILQMIAGISIEIYNITFCPCQDIWSPIFGLIMYATYFILFFQYWYSRYHLASSHHAKKKTE